MVHFYIFHVPNMDVVLELIVMILLKEIQEYIRVGVLVMMIVLQLLLVLELILMMVSHMLVDLLIVKFVDMVLQVLERYMEFMILEALMVNML